MLKKHSVTYPILVQLELVSRRQKYQYSGIFDAPKLVQLELVLKKHSVTYLASAELVQPTRVPIISLLLIAFLTGS